MLKSVNELNQLIAIILDFWYSKINNTLKDNRISLVEED